MVKGYSWEVYPLSMKGLGYPTKTFGPKLLPRHRGVAEWKPIYWDQLFIHSTSRVSCQLKSTPNLRPLRQASTHRSPSMIESSVRSIRLFCFSRVTYWLASVSVCLIPFDLLILPRNYSLPGIRIQLIAEKTWKHYTIVSVILVIINFVHALRSSWDADMRRMSESSALGQKLF